MKRITPGRYSKEFREKAVQHIIEQGLSVPEASRRLDVPKSTLSYWVKSSKAGNLESIGKNRCVLTSVELELPKLRRELAKIEMEQDILKKLRRTSRRSRYEIRHDRLLSAPILPTDLTLTRRVLRFWLIEKDHLMKNHPKDVRSLFQTYSKK